MATLLSYGLPNVPKIGCQVGGARTVYDESVHLRNAANETIEWATEVYDYGGCFTAGDYALFAPVTGVYWIYMSMFVGGVTTSYCAVRAYKNTTQIKEGLFGGNTGGYVSPSVGALVELTAGDYVKFHAIQETGSTKDFSNSNVYTWAGTLLVAV